MDGPPRIWRAPFGTAYPASDPAPPGKTSKPAQWQDLEWRSLAEQALAGRVPGHLSLIDSEGFPLPIRVQAVTLTNTGLAVDLPRGVPWLTEGKACLTFGGIETFLGEVAVRDRQALLTVERTLPIFPMTQDMTQLWNPTPDTRMQLMRRLEEELARRGQPVPTIPVERPPPSDGYRRRMERMKAARS